MPEAIGQRLLTERGRYDEIPVDRHGVSQRQDVLVVEPRRETDLPMDQLERLLVELIRMRDLQRYADTLDRVVGFVHGGKRTGADAAPDTVLAQHLPRPKGDLGRPSPGHRKRAATHLRGDSDIDGEATHAVSTFDESWTDPIPRGILVGMNRKRTGRTLVVTDDAELQEKLRTELAHPGQIVETAADETAALELIERSTPDLVFVDVTSSGIDGFGLLRQASVLRPSASLIATVGTGAVDGHALQSARPEHIVGAHPAMQRLFKRMLQAAKSRSTILIQGETGTGKELIAKAVHEHSARREGPLVRLNCAALAESVLESELFGHEKGAFTGAVTRRSGRFEQADGGTLFLDELSEMPLSVQVKLLRFLQEREFERVGGNETINVNVRVVAATNRDLRTLVDDGKFREDLYFRLKVVVLEVPPLRTRPSDIPLLADHFLRHYAAENGKTVHGFTNEARDALLAYPWPGNVRELQHAIEQGVVLCEGDLLSMDDLPIASRDADVEPLSLMVPGVTLDEVERYTILKTLDAVGGSPTKAARILGVSKRTIQYRMQEWGGTKKPGTP